MAEAMRELLSYFRKMAARGGHKGKREEREIMRTSSIASPRPLTNSERLFGKWEPRQTEGQIQGASEELAPIGVNTRTRRHIPDMGDHLLVDTLGKGC